MKVLNLRCSRQHHFEGWFASEDDFRLQGERGQLHCPLCGDPTVQKLPSAARLNLKHARETAVSQVDAPVPAEAHAPAPTHPSHGLLMQALRELVNATEDVGDRLAEQARAMHQGEMVPRHIRGRASLEVAQELWAEGIELLPLPALPPDKTSLH